MNTRFLPEINAINKTITAFNRFLNPIYKIPVLNPDRMIEEKYCSEIKHGRWDDFDFPNAPKRGVYFIFGHDKANESTNGLYIGKASFSSAIGARLDHHLRPYKKSSCFEMNGNRGEKYVLDYMASIELESLNLVFMSPALEEYLISELRGQLKLMNGTGN